MVRKAACQLHRRALPVLTSILVLLPALVFGHGIPPGAAQAPNENPLVEALSAQREVPDFQHDPVEYWASRVLTWTLIATIFIVVYSLFRVFRGQISGFATKGLLVTSIILLPIFSVSTGMVLVFSRAERVEFCGSCHRALKPYVDDMRNPQSEGLAAIHYRNQLIASNQCYECHTSYGLFGTVKAKLEGIQQVVRYYTNAYELPLEMWKPYSNEDCLKCHSQSVRWLAHEEHMAPDQKQALMQGRASCMDCHMAGHSDEIVSAGSAP
jgi:nitrate/TMAO reductase-like tetraheme cytochrome c subunit